jgi:Transcriptional regulators
MASKKSATIQDVANHAGVSKTAVSKVIRNAYGVSDAMRDRVNAAIKDLDYRPSVAARSLRGSSYTIGVELPRVNNPLFDEIVTGATKSLLDTPYQLVLAPATSDRGEGVRAINALVDRQVDGLVVVSPVVDRPWLENIAQRIPTVMVGRHDDTKFYDTVTVDDVIGTTLLIQHLLDLGHRRIAHVTVRHASATPGTTSPHALRLETYERMLRAAGGKPIVVQASSDLEEDIRGLVRALLDSAERPTAIFAGNDTIALSAMWAIAEAGLTQADVSVVGFDNIEIAAHPLISLTTIDHSGEEMGRQAISLLLERIDGRADARHIQLDPRLYVRGSSVQLLPS